MKHSRCAGCNFHENSFVQTHLKNASAKKHRRHCVCAHFQIIHLHHSFQATEQKVQLAKEKQAPPEARPVVIRQPEVIDDFIRNFLKNNGMEGTLNVFESEWYAKQTELAEKHGGLGKMLVPDVYQQNAQLEEQNKNLTEELKRARETAEAATAKHEKAKKDAQRHMMEHRRVTQQNVGLTKDLKRAVQQCERYEPMIAQMEGRCVWAFFIFRGK